MSQAGPVDAFAAKVQAAQADLQHGIERAGLRDDPLRHPLQALSSVIGLFPDLMRQVTSAIDEARQPIDPAAVERLEQAAATGADQRAAALARAHNLRSFLIYVGVLGAVALVAGAGCYQWGWSSADATIRHADQRFAAAFRDGPSGAASWAKLMELNDLSGALSLCVGPRSYLDPSGRKVCLVPLYMDPPRRAAPSEAQR